MIFNGFLRCSILLFNLAWFSVRSHGLATPTVQKRAQLSWKDLSLEKIEGKDFGESGISWTEPPHAALHERMVEREFHMYELMALDYRGQPQPQLPQERQWGDLMEEPLDDLREADFVEGIEAMEGYQLTTFAWGNVEARMLVILGFPRLAIVMPLSRKIFRLIRTDTVGFESGYREHWGRQKFGEEDHDTGVIGEEIAYYLDYPKGLAERPKGLIMIPKIHKEEWERETDRLIQLIKEDVRRVLGHLSKNLMSPQFNAVEWKEVTFGDDYAELSSSRGETCVEEDEGDATNTDAESNTGSDWDADPNNDSTATTPLAGNDMDDYEDYFSLEETLRLQKEGGKIGFAYLCIDPAKKQWEWGVFVKGYKNGKEPAISGFAQLDISTENQNADDSGDDVQFE